jgi:hypothetical protein
MPSAPAAPAYAALDRHLAAIAANTGYTANHIREALGMS